MIKRQLLSERVACAGAIVFDEAGRLLLVQRAGPPSAGSWSVPGGRCLPGESAAQACVREVAEETGLKAECGDLLGWAERVGSGHHFVILDFLVTVSEAQPVAGDDAAEAGWFRLSSVPELDLVDGLAGFLRDHGVL
jgi:acetyl-CoA carboxylase carboxyl transferase subunit beta